MINFATVGSGSICQSFINGSKKVDTLNHYAIYSRSEKRASEFAKANNINVYYTDLEEMAKDDNIDAVYIASPNSLHFQQSMLFLNNNKHVICEKPLSASPSEVKLLIDTAKEKGLVFMEAITVIHSPNLIKLEKAMEEIGNIYWANFSYLQFSSKYPSFIKGENPNVFTPEFHGGSVMDLGVYTVYPALYLFGEYEKLTASAVLAPNGIDLCGTSILQYKDKVVTLSYAKSSQNDKGSQICGDKGSIYIEMISKVINIKIVYCDGSEKIIESMENDTPLQFEAQFFASAILNYKLYENKLDKYNALAIKVSETLKEIRNTVGMTF